MIVAIEGLIPDRRLSPSGAQPAAPPVNADIYSSKWLRKQEHEPADEELTDLAAATKPQPAAPHVPEPELTLEPAPKPANDTSSPSLDRTNPPLPIPSSTPEARTGFPTQPA
jgi:hypothetical protein